MDSLLLYIREFCIFDVDQVLFFSRFLIYFEEYAEFLVIELGIGLYLINLINVFHEAIKNVFFFSLYSSCDVCTEWVYMHVLSF